jgi:hypothetical protein
MQSLQNPKHRPVEIKPLRTQRFRGFTYNTPPPDQVVPVT